MLELKKIVMAFFEFVQDNGIEIYNEFSLQHELGIYLRQNLPEYKVQFERHVSFFTGDTRTIKKEIDVSVFSEDKGEKYAVELKCPMNGQHPEQMYSFCKDIKFMEELKERGFRSTACVALVSDRLFYEGRGESGIYKHFRDEYAVYGRIFKPTGLGKMTESIALSGRYEIQWRELGGPWKYYVVEM